MNRYDISAEEAENLPNKLGLTDADAINEEELVGFLRAEEAAIDALDGATEFSPGYLYELHRSALGHVYDFAGLLRMVNMSKGGFAFPAAQFLPENMRTFDEQFLHPINAQAWEDVSTLLEHLADMHAELLYIHPFREGNGRTVRLFTKLILLAKSGQELDFELLTEGDNPRRYIEAVQQAATGKYSLMCALFREMQARLH